LPLAGPQPNFGLQAVEGLTATFYAYAGDLSELGGDLPPQAQIIGSAQTLPAIEAQSAQVAGVTWTPPDPTAVYAIFCELGGDVEGWYGSDNYPADASSLPAGAGQTLGYNAYPPDYFSQSPS
jgi:hypothetical protein